MNPPAGMTPPPGGRGGVEAGEPAPTCGLLGKAGTVTGEIGLAPGSCLAQDAKSALVRS